MEITPVGIVILSLSIFLIVRLKLSIMLKLLIFSLPFSGIAVINFLPHTIGIGIDRYFTVLLIISLLLSLIINEYKAPPIPVEIKQLGILFLLMVGISWYATLHFENIFIWKEELSYFYKIPLKFCFTNLQKAFELLISYMLFISVYKTINLVSPLKIARITIISLVVMGLSVFLVNIPVFSKLSSAILTNVSYSTGGGGIGPGYYRVIRSSGLAIEASYVSIFMLQGLAMISSFFKNHHYIFNRNVDIALVIIFLFAGMMSFSPSILLGFLIIPAYFFLWKPKRGTIFRGIIFVMIFLISLIIISHCIHKNFLKIMFMTALGKMGVAQQYTDFHSEFRLNAIISAWEVFRQSPWIGVGWGSFSIQCGFPQYLLANIGIIGTTIFMFLLIRLLCLSKKILRYSDNLEEKMVREGFLLTFVMILAMCTITKGILLFVYLPFVFIVAASIGRYKIKEMKFETTA